MRVISVQSGSNGNCVYVEASGTQVLIDAGISGSQAQQRLRAHGVDINSVDAMLISHDHIDHTRCMGVYHRKYALPVYATEATLAEVRAYRDVGRMDDIRHFEAGTSFRVGRLTIESIPTPHDAADGVAFVVDDGKRRVGILTDLGHVFDGLDEIVRSLHGVVIESNYDPEMLASGPYPASLARVKSERGLDGRNRVVVDLMAQLQRSPSLPAVPRIPNSQKFVQPPRVRRSRNCTRSTSPQQENATCQLRSPR